MVRGTLRLKSQNLCWVSHNEKDVRVLYLTWGEVIVRNGIFRNQVVEQLMLTGREVPGVELHLLSGVPVVNMKLLKSPRRFFKEIAGFRAKLKGGGIPFSVRMIPVVSSWFYSKKWQFPLYALFNAGFLRRYTRKHTIDVVHCRSYHATLFALKTRERHGLSYKVIFDTRGLFPEEGIIKNAYKMGDQEFAYCKKVEKYCLENADEIVNVSNTFSTYIRSITANPHVSTIFTSVNLDLFFPDAGLRERSRESLGIAAGEKILVYLGDVRNSGWHQSSNLARLFKAFAAIFPESRLFVITEQDHAGLKANMAEFGISGDRMLVASSTTQTGINALLNAADFACLPFRDVKNEVDRLLGYTMIASKTGEYLAAGLPVVTNELVGAASELVSREGLGVVYSESDQGIRFHDATWTGADAVGRMKNRAPVIAGEYFNGAQNAERYGKIYRKLSCLA